MTNDNPLTPDREREIRRAHTHCEAARFETEDERPLHAWGPSQEPIKEMCQLCTMMRAWAEDSDESVLLAEVDRLRARVAELESATGTARAMHRKHADSEHCQAPRIPEQHRTGGRPSRHPSHCGYPAWRL